MKTKIISILTILVILFNIIPITNVFASSTSFSLTITANKQTAKAGDTITYTITANATGGITILDFYLDIPDGLTYVENSGTIGAEIGNIAEKGFTQNDQGCIYTFANDTAFELNNVQLGTFECTVNDNTSGDCTVGVKEFEVCDENLEEISSSNITKNYTKVTVVLEATGVSLNKETENLNIGGQTTLVATLTPEGTTDSVKEWASSDTNVATVNNGVVTAVSEGTATITVKTTNDKTASCVITVVCAHTNKTEVAAVEPTCTQTGNNKYYVCDDCGKIFKADGLTETSVANETIAALGHDFSLEKNNETQHWKECSRCGEKTEIQNHESDTWISDDTHHWKVCGCGVVISKEEHTHGTSVREREVAPTCKTKGSHDEVTYCTICGKELSRISVEDEKVQHTPGTPVQEHIVPATHAEEGSYEEVIYCSVCEEELSRTQKTIPVIPHDGSQSPWYSDENEHWKVCGCGVKVDVANHEAGEMVKEKIVAPTCTENGKHDEVVYCSICGHEISRVRDVVDAATGHNEGAPVRENVVEATCTKEGSYDEVVYCSVCGEELSRTKKVIEKTAHTPADAVKENEVKSTVNKEGSYDEVIYCKDCGKELSRVGKTTPKFVYEVLEGKDGEHEDETQGTLTFKVNGEFSKFTGLKIDDKEVDKSKYTVKSGSTIVTLDADYLNSLSVGTHKIAFVYDDGEVTTNFKVSEVVKDDNKEQETKQENNNSEISNENKDTSVEEKTSTKNNKSSVNTGDNSNITIWTLGLLASAILFVIIVKCIVKNRKSQH